MAKSPYRGAGGRLYRRQAEALKAQCRASGQGCSVCGQQFDFANSNSARGFTADHPVPLAAGGKLVGQRLVPLCRSCNSRKKDVVPPVLRPAS